MPSMGESFFSHTDRKQPPPRKSNIGRGFHPKKAK